MNQFNTKLNKKENLSFIFLFEVFEDEKYGNLPKF